MPHVWGPWHEKLNVFGEAIGYGERRCLNCQWPESVRIPTVCELQGMSRGERRQRDAGGGR